jgi:DNA repair exonuclease SbcCD nuclease subunit
MEMMINPVKIYDSHIAVIADLHLGIHTNSESWHDIIMDYGKWLQKELTAKNIKDIIILGDIFNDREEIGVKTLSTAKDFFKLFREFNVILLVGNHDCFMKNSSEINSTCIFEGWNNITVIDKMESVNIHNRNLLFCPWGSNLTEAISIYDIVFGHFEINTFKKGVAKICDDGIDSSVLLEKAKLIMSGHFHLRDERTYPDGKIVYVGSPYCQTWNDLNERKGYYILDLEKSTYEFFENTISPKYYFFKLSEFFDPRKLGTIKGFIPHNFIKIQVDMPLEYEKFEKILATLSSLNPMEISSDFTTGEEVVANKDYEIVHLDTKTLIEDFVKSLELPTIKQKVISEMEEIYNKALSRVIIEEN